MSDQWPGSDAPPGTKVTKDYRNAPWGDVAWQAAKGVIPSYVSDTVNGVKALAGGAANMFVPQSAAQVSQMRADQRARDSAPASANVNDAMKVVHGVGNYVHDRYLAPGALKQTLATDPGGVLMDAQTALTPFESVPGDVGRVASIAGRVTNPVRVAGEALAAGSGLAQKAIRGGSALDAQGNFTPQAMAAVQKAFPNGEVTPAELANPKFKALLASGFQSKGVDPSVVREAVLQYHGAPTSRSIVTRSKAPGSAAPVAADNAADARKAIGASAQALAGSSAPDPSALGAALEKAHAASLGAATAKYEALRDVPGSFGESLPAGPLQDEIGAKLAEHGIPATPDLLARSADAYPQANRAYGLVKDALVDGKTRLGGEITAPEVLEVRRQLTGLQQDASGSDRQAVRDIIDGLHSNLENAADWGWFRGPDGISDTNISGLLRDANDAYKQHFDTFDNNQGPAAAIKRAVKSLSGSDKAGVADDEAQIAAQKGLTQKLMSPTDGPATYGLLESVLPDPAPLNDYVRQSVLRTDENGNLIAKPAQLRGFLDTPMADKVFSPEERSDIRLMAAGSDVLGAKPIPGSGGRFPDLLNSKILRAGAGTIAGGIAGHLAFPGPVGEGIGSTAGFLSEQGLEKLATERQAASEAAGAPSKGAMLNIPQTLGSATERAGIAAPFVGQRADTQPTKIVPLTDISAQSNPVPAETSAPMPATKTAKDQWQGSDKPPHEDEWPGTDAPAPDNPGFASGGATGAKFEQLVERLMGAAKKAKTDAKRATEPFLKIPDASIAKALALAQKNI